jgi:hypothetical protein
LKTTRIADLDSMTRYHTEINKTTVELSVLCIYSSLLLRRDKWIFFWDEKKRKEIPTTMDNYED